MIATFLYHELFTVRMLHPSSPLHYVSYFQFATTDVNRATYVETSLPWQNKKGCPALTGIPIHCALLNKLLQIHDLQKKLPKEIMKKVVDELNTRNIGDPEILMSNKVLEKMEIMTQKVVDKLDKIDQMEKQSVPEYHESKIFELTTTAEDARLTASSNKTTGPVCLFPSQGIWQHYWGDCVRRVPETFQFPRSKTLLSLWTSWHIPDFKLKVCPWKYLEDKDFSHIPRGKTKYNEMRLIINELLLEIAKDEKLKKEYEMGNKNLTKLTEIFEKVKFIFQNTHLRRVRLTQMSWETFVRDARNLKHDREKPDEPKRYSTNYVSEQPTRKKRGRPRKTAKAASTTANTMSTKKYTRPKHAMPRNASAKKNPIQLLNLLQLQPQFLPKIQKGEEIKAKGLVRLHVYCDQEGRTLHLITHLIILTNALRTQPRN